jgi:hypothetical protein
MAWYPAGGIVSTTGVDCCPEELAVVKGEQAFKIRIKRSMLAIRLVFMVVSFGIPFPLLMAPVSAGHGATQKTPRRH